MRPLIIVQWIAIGILLLYSIAATLLYEDTIQPRRNVANPQQFNTAPNVPYTCTYTYGIYDPNKPTGVTCK